MGFDIDTRYPEKQLKPGTATLVCWNYEKNLKHGRRPARYEGFLSDNSDDGWHDGDDDYWIGVICNEETMPAKLWQSRRNAVVPRENGNVLPPVRRGVPMQYPVFLPTKGEFYWLPRSVIGYLGEQNGNIYAQRQFDFKILYEMAIDTKRYRREYWLGLAKHAIREDSVRKADQRKAGSTTKSTPGVSITEDEARDEEEESDSHLEDSEYEQPTRKRARTRVASSPHITRSTTVPGRPSSTVAATESNDSNRVKIKEECDEDGCHQVITVYIGKQNDVFKFSRDDLLQSPVLSGYIHGRSFIMDPDLMEIDSDLFKSVDEFLKAAEFLPCYILEEGTANYSPTSAGRLDGINTYEEYSEQLLRLGKLYILAWKLKIPNMKLLIHQKVINGFPGGPRRCRSDFAMLGLVKQIFRDMPGSVENAAADQSEGVQTNDPLKEWLITWLAEHMRRCAQSLEPGVRDDYWYTLDRGVGLDVAVFRVKAQMMVDKGELFKTLDDEVDDAVQE